MTFTFTAVVKATAAKFNFAACCAHAKCSFRVQLHTKIFLGACQKLFAINNKYVETSVKI
jgi:hypothetical protein